MKHVKRMFKFQRISNPIQRRPENPKGAVITTTLIIPTFFTLEEFGKLWDPMPSMSQAGLAIQRWGCTCLQLADGGIFRKQGWHLAATWLLRTRNGGCGIMRNIKHGSLGGSRKQLKMLLHNVHDFRTKCHTQRYLGNRACDHKAHVHGHQGIQPGVHRRQGSC